MSGEASSDKLGRLVGKARRRSVDTGQGFWDRVQVVRRRGPSGKQSEYSREASTVPGPVEAAELAPDGADLVDVDLSDALVRAEAAEAEVARLRAELGKKDEILAEARIALRTARLALRDHLRITQDQP